VQLEVQVLLWVPQSPQPWYRVSVGVQTPWPVHEDQEPQAQLEVQVRL
jgi:hypothetical protein